MENKTFTFTKWHTRYWVSIFDNSVDTLLYDDELQVTSIDDLVKYIQSEVEFQKIGSQEEKSCVKGGSTFL